MRKTAVVTVVRVFVLIVVAGVAGACGREAAEPPERPPFEVVEATIAEAQSAIREGRTTCSEVVAAHLARVEAYDKKTGLNAITVVNPQALARADDRAGDAPPQSAGGIPFPDVQSGRRSAMTAAGLAAFLSAFRRGN